MTVLKWIVVVVFGLAGAGALAMGVMEGSVVRVVQPAAPLAMTLRPFPGAQAPVAAPSTPSDDALAAPAKAEPEKAEPEKAEPEKAEPAKAEPAKPEPGKAEPAKAEAAPVGEGLLNLRASDTADVYVDGKKAGGSPVLGLKVKAGAHKVRFDCYDAAGNAAPGPVKSVTAKADEEVDFEYACPE